MYQSKQCNKTDVLQSADGKKYQMCDHPYFNNYERTQDD